MQTTQQNGTTANRIALASLCLLSLAGCRRDMQDQPKYKPLAASRFFLDGRSARSLPRGAIARGSLNDTDTLHTGVSQGTFLAQLPMPITPGLLQKGREQYNVFCTPCHGMVGDGRGMVAYRGLKWPADLTNQRTRNAPPGYIFQVITNGYGAMGDYGDQIEVGDRWAIIAYLHALQLSRSAPLSELPTDVQAKLERQP